MRLFSKFSIFALLSTFLLFYALLFQFQHSQSNLPVIRNVENDAKLGHPIFAKRAGEADYAKAVVKGRTLHCRLRMTQQQAQASNGDDPLEAKDEMQNSLFKKEGWVQVKESPSFGKALDAAFQGLGVGTNLNLQQWYDELDTKQRKTGTTVSRDKSLRILAC